MQIFWGKEEKKYRRHIVNYIIIEFLMLSSQVFECEKLLKQKYVY